MSLACAARCGRFGVLLWLAGGALAACHSVDPDALALPDDAGEPASANGDAAIPVAGTSGLPVPTTGGSGGMDGAGSGGGGAGGTGGIPGACVPNPDTTNEVCTEICPETCNGEDDDCDRKVDEGEADEACAFDHAQASCVRGTCVIGDCEEGWRDCDGNAKNGCEAGETDVDHCGTCGHACSFRNAIAACVDEKCEPVGCVELFEDCNMDGVDCETPTNTLEHCGACDETCSALPNATVDCSTGTCSPGSCNEGYGDCDGDVADGCEQMLDALQHCGACNTPCDFASSTGDDCSTRVCVAGACKPGYQDCDGDRLDGCESLSSGSHCGACGKTCDASLDHTNSEVCDKGTCKVTCDTGFGNCDLDPFTGCEASIRTLERCDDCGTTCAFPHAVASCSTGTCTFVRCEAGWADCAGGVANGCEQSLDDDAHCGSCTNQCGSGANAGKPNCAGGVCTAANCSAGTADCNGDGTTCETDTTNDELHCGACGAPCPVSAAHATSVQCVSGKCAPVCEALRDDCNHDVTDGCEVSLETLTNCGSCGTACAIPNAMETCTGGTCAVDQCEDDAGDCDSDPLTCETPLDTVQHCGNCVTACNLTNATAECGGSPGARACEITHCTQTYYRDCDGVDATGCEADARTDASDCGQCNFDCTAQANVASATCSAMSCNFTCDTGYGDCNDLDSDGCEERTNTAAHCGDCGVPCTRSHGTASCTSGACQLTGCDANYQNCDGNEANGCEPLNTLANCGSCGAACTVPNGVGTCASMDCAVSSCDAGWADCDGDVANGCEHDSRTPALGGLGPCLPESGCTRETHDGRDYYFCTTNRSWTTARNNCRLLAGTELVRIDDQVEQNFVLSHLAAEAWIAANDRGVEGEWRWAEGGADAGTQFWSGTGTGTTVGGLYENWNASEPNDDPSPADCGSMLSTVSGTWNDRACGDALDYVCEQIADLCPSDPDKTVPGICGCGVADTNTDGDSQANCNETCDDDPNKLAPGQCGCGIADTDTDMDGVANCNDGCPTNPEKTVAPCTWAPDNYNPDLYTHTRVVNFNCGTTHTFNSTTGAWDTTCCGACPHISAAVAQTTGGAPQVRVLSMASLNVAAGVTLRLIGNYPVIFSVDQNATISGTVDAGSTGTIGAGGNANCAGGGNGTNGTAIGSASGAGGGSFGGAGGYGGDGCFGESNGDAGGVHGSANLTPLEGGCRGGTGGGSGGAGGAGGGAVQIAVRVNLTFGSGAIVSAAGAGGGSGGSGTTTGGGGGGSGGGVLIQYGGTYTNNGSLRAHGGGGGEGADASGNSQAGHLSDDTRATGGSGGSGGDGGRGATRCSGACTATDQGPTNGLDIKLYSLCGGLNGGGGGGGAGRVVATQK